VRGPMPIHKRLSLCFQVPVALVIAFVTLSLILATAPGTHAEVISVDTIGPIDYVARISAPRASGHDGPRVAIALSGGGARGLAQIGVLRAFEEAGIAIEVICGVSMGAIIGGLYASGIGPDSLVALTRSVDWGALLENSPPRARLLLSQKDRSANWFLSLPMRGLQPQWPTGATSGQGIYNFLAHLTQGASYRCGGDFDRLPTRFRAVATDLVSGDHIVFDSGELAFAMRAAMAFPLAVTPLRSNGRLFADGGLVDPLPVALTQSLSDAPVVAVNTATALEEIDRIGDPYVVANQATTIMTAPALATALAQADFTCEPSVVGIANYDFDAVDSLIAAGYAAGQLLAQRIIASQSASGGRSLRSGGMHFAPLHAVDGLTPPDCPPAIAEWVAETTSVELALVRDSARTAVASGWWSRATLSHVIVSDSGGERMELSAQRAPSLRVIRFEGNSAFTETELKHAMDLPIGHPVAPDEMIAGLRRARDQYERRQYTLADIRDATLDSDGVLTVSIDEASLSGVEVEGNQSVRNWVILRNFPLQRGAPYNARRVANGLFDLQATGLFDQITARVVRTDAGPILRLTVTEKTTDALRLGLHHNLEYQTEGFIQWTNINLFGLGNEFTAHAQYAPRRELYFGQIDSDRVFRSYMAARLGVYYHRQRRHFYADHVSTGDFQTKRTGVRARFAQNISRFAQLAVQISTERLQLEIDSTTSRLQHARIALGAHLDDLDERDFPQTGRRLSAELIWADDFLDGDIIYRAFFSEALWVIPFRDHLILLTGARFGTADRQLPVYEKFALGGRRSLMGLYEDEMLGDHVLAANVVMRYRIYSRSYTLARLDVGNAWRHGVDVDFWGTLRAGLGMGLMFDTPLGPLTILQGFADGGDERFYFSWGYDF